jgi:tetratricopeptide (TPR) repeat protein
VGSPSGPEPVAKQTACRLSTSGRWRWVLAATALAGSAMGVWLWPASDRDRGLEAAGRGDFETAEPFLRSARDRNPDDLAVIRALATGYGNAERGDEAAAEFARWTDLRPDDPEPVAATFRLWLRLRHFDRAAEAARRWLRLGHVEPEAFPQIVAVFMLVGGPREAADAARIGLAVDPRSARLRFQLAEALRAIGVTSEARGELDRLTREAPEFPEGWRLRGVMAAEADDPSAAIGFLERALGFRPADLEARYALGLALRRCGREDDARRELDRFEKTRLAVDLAEISSAQPEQVDLAVRTAASFFDAGLNREGHEYLRRALDRDPNNAAALRLRDAHQSTLPR